MERKQVEALRVGDVVQWEDDPLDTGRVIERNVNGVRIKWVNGYQGWIDNQDGKDLTYRPELSKPDKR